MFSLLTTHPFDIFDLTGSDLAIVLLMVIVFVLALVLPHPGHGHIGRKRS